jgi:hypothetical protein
MNTVVYIKDYQPEYVVLEKLVLLTSTFWMNAK